MADPRAPLTSKPAGRRPEPAGPPLVVAHRGASGLAPENTLRAFRRAIAVGADFLECDVRPTRDGVPVVFHDSDLQRLVGRRGRIEDLTLEEVRSLRIRRGPAARPRGEPIPSLEDLAAVALGRVRLAVEIKVEGDAPTFVRRVARLLRETGHADAVLISFSPLVIDRLHTQVRWKRAGLILGTRTPVEWVHVHLVRPEPLLVLQKSLASRDVVRKARAMGKELWTYSVDRADEQRRFIARGVGGIITNHPEKLVRVLREDFRERAGKR